MKRLAHVAACALFLVGCNARPLVTVRRVGEPTSACKPNVLTCGALKAVDQHVPIADDAFEAEPMACLSAAAPDCGDSPLRGEGGCRGSRPWLPGGAGALKGASVACAVLRVSLADNETFTLEGPTLKDVELMVAGGAGSTFRIEGGTLSRVRFTLHGNVWLELADGTRGMSVVVDAGPEVEGTAVTVSDADMSDLRVRTGARSEVVVRRSNVAHMTARGGSLASDDTLFSEARLRFESAALVYGEIHNLDADIAETHLRGGEVRGARFFGCRSFDAYGSRMELSHIDRCETPIELSRDASLLDSTVRGDLLVLGAVVERVTVEAGNGALVELGPRAEFTESLLCDTEAVLVNGADAVACNRCDPGVETVSALSLTSDNPECPPLDRVGPGSGPV